MKDRKAYRRIRARIRKSLGPSLPEALSRGDVTVEDVTVHLLALMDLGMERPTAIYAAERFVDTFK